MCFVSGDARYGMSWIYSMEQEFSWIREMIQFTIVYGMVSYDFYRE